MKIVDSHGELKLTKPGYLPPKIVKDIYAQGFLKDKIIEFGISKLSKELDSMTIGLTKNLFEMTGLGKKKK